MVGDCSLHARLVRLLKSRLGHIIISVGQIVYATDEEVASGAWRKKAEYIRQRHHLQVAHQSPCVCVASCWQCILLLTWCTCGVLTVMIVKTIKKQNSISWLAGAPASAFVQMVMEMQKNKPAQTRPSSLGPTAGGSEAAHHYRFPTRAGRTLTDLARRKAASGAAQLEIEAGTTSGLTPSSHLASRHTRILMRLHSCCLTFRYRIRFILSRPTSAQEFLGTGTYKCLNCSSVASLLTLTHVHWVL